MEATPKASYADVLKKPAPQQDKLEPAAREAKFDWKRFEELLGNSDGPKDWADESTDPEVKSKGDVTENKSAYSTMNEST